MESKLSLWNGYKFTSNTHTSSRIPGHFVTTDRWHLLCTTHVQTLNRNMIRLVNDFYLYASNYSKSKASAIKSNLEWSRQHFIFDWIVASKLVHWNKENWETAKRNKTEVTNKRSSLNQCQFKFMEALLCPNSAWFILQNL